MLEPTFKAPLRGTFQNYVALTLDVGLDVKRNC